MPHSKAQEPQVNVPKVASTPLSGELKSKPLLLGHPNPTQVAPPVSLGSEAPSPDADHFTCWDAWQNQSIGGLLGTLQAGAGRPGNQKNNHVRADPSVDLCVYIYIYDLHMQEYTGIYSNIQECTGIDIYIYIYMYVYIQKKRDLSSSPFIGSGGNAQEVCCRVLGNLEQLIQLLIWATVRIGLSGHGKLGHCPPAIVRNIVSHLISLHKWPQTTAYVERERHAMMFKVRNP